jgi:hypothetical protein
VSTTGIAGLTLGGGQGWLRRTYGMTCDSLLSTDVITADGEFVTASDAERVDLFWALRGGGATSESSPTSSTGCIRSAGRDRPLLHRNITAQHVFPIACYLQTATINAMMPTRTPAIAIPNASRSRASRACAVVTTAFSCDAS